MISPHARGASTSRAVVCATTLACSLAATACIAPQRAEGMLVMASGADLESANPLVTVHPLSKQVQRYALFVTLVRYDSALAAQPYFARRWTWSDDHRTLTLALAHDLRWHDGAPTTARDAASAMSVRDAG